VIPRTAHRALSRRFPPYLPFAITIPLVPEHAASLTRLLPWIEAWSVV
jgi:hypothetical protein